jgi:hypothetical protein
MVSLNKFFIDNLSLALILFGLWLGILSFLLFQAIRHYNNLARGAKDKDLTSILTEISQKIGLSDKKFEKIEKAIVEIIHKNRLHLQKFSLVRFNPFSDQGGDQSFAIAILDENNDGLVISNLHSRDFSRIYAKPVKAGQAEKYQFSKEEQEAVLKAKNKK